MINLEFIIPIKVDFKDRENNLKVVIQHIRNKYDYLINVIECDNQSKLKEDETFKKYFFRKRFLIQLLKKRKLYKFPNYYSI